MRLKTRLLCAGAMLAMAGAAAPLGGAARAQDAAAAQSTKVRIDIPAGPAATGLNTLATQTGLQIFYAFDLVRGRTIPAIKGDYDRTEALAQVSRAAGLEIASNDGHTVTLAADPQGTGAGGGADTNVVQELVVTAQKKQENIQVVPIAISAFSQQDLTTRQVTGGPDLMTQVPNFTFTKTNFSGYSIQIRGIGTQAISATTDPAVAVAFNNTPFIRNRFFEQEFYDLERLEVLRGPQGTLYGRNATAGVVNILSAKPNLGEFQAKASADVGNYSSKRLEGMINIPLAADKAGLRLAGAWTKRDGFVKNILTGRQTDGRDLWSGRATLRIEPSDWFSANLVYEHFEENDDRLRSGKQLCNKDPGPAEIGGVPIQQTGYPLSPGANYFSQGCKPASLYSPDSFQTPNGYSLAYYGAAGALGSPVYIDLDPYAHQTQSRDLREIETHLTPEYDASNDTVELQLHFDLPGNLSLTSETGFGRDQIFSFEDYNRFDTTPNVFQPGGINTVKDYNWVSQDGVFCDPQLGCTNRLAAGDLSTAKSRQFSQEFRLSSNYDGKLNFSLGGNFLSYDTEDKYYVFVNTLTAYKAGFSAPWIPNQSDNSDRCFGGPGLPVFKGYGSNNPNVVYNIQGCDYIDPNDIHNLNDQGRNYFLSKNPYKLISYAGFGEAYYQVTPDLKLTGGVRWTVDHKVAPQIPSWLLTPYTYGTPARKIIKLDWSEPTGRVAIDWKPKLSFTDETLLYASYVRGYKAGGSNPPLPVVVEYGGSDAIDAALIASSLAHPETFKAEFVNAFEIGTKNTLLDGRLTFNLNAFYYDYTGYQISEIVDRSALNFNFDAKIWGSELEMDWRPMKNLRLGLKGGYENTRLADGSMAIDLMDRTAGHAGWVVEKPFPTFPSNCIVPVWLAVWNNEPHDICSGYATNTDPATGLPYKPNPTVNSDGNSISNHWGDHYPGYDPASAPNNGAGFAKDLSGNALPNAPHFTLTVTTDYTLPLGENWLATLHGDFYYQSEAWTRVFNTPGYDKLKAYTNVNFAAIFVNETAGLQVMAYVKNVFDRDSITGAFLNSDDTGLTTNVFLTEPRLFGVRVTKNWSGDAPLGAWLGEHKPGSPYPFRVELGGEYGHFTQGHELFAPAITRLFTPDFPFPFGVQTKLAWGTSGEAKITYMPPQDGWSFSLGVHYGRAGGEDAALKTKRVKGGFALGGQLYYAPSDHGLFDYAKTEGQNDESHTTIDFMVGKDVGLGGLARQASSTLSAGLRYAHLSSSQVVHMSARPDFTFPADNIIKYGATMHRLNASMNADREFEGAGLALAWDGSLPLGGDPLGAGRWNVDLGVGGGVLWGKQQAQVRDAVKGDNVGGVLKFFSGNTYDITPPYSTSANIVRSKSVSVPTAEANVGLSYDLGRMTIRTGYRWERYFDVIDGGIEARKTYDRQFDGPYFRVSVGFGG